MTRIQRYVFRELLGPTLVGLLAYGLIILMNLSMSAAEMMIRRDLPAPLVLQFMALALPRIVVLTLPMAVLLGVLVGIGRLAADHELSALRALGFNDRRLIRAALALGVLAATVTWFVFDAAVPAANYAQHQLQARIFISSDLNREIQARTFYEKIPDLLIYADDADAVDGTLHRVLIHQKTDDGRDEISTSGRARIEYGESDGFLNFRLEDVVSHSWDRTDPRVYQVARRETETIVRPPDIFTTEMLRTLENPPPRNLREQSVVQLLETIQSFGEKGSGAIRKRYRREAWVELHKKFALPATCIVFAFLALPLALSQRRGGKTVGFLISLLVVAVQYFLLTMGEQLADRGAIAPWLAMWMGNILFLALGAGFFVLGSRWSWDPKSALDRIAFWRKLGGDAPRRRSSRDLDPREEAESAPLSGKARPRPDDLPLWRRRILPAIDLYLLKVLLVVGVLVGLSLALLFALYATLDMVDDMTRSDQPFTLFLQYLVNVLPQFITNYVVPIVLCASTLITFALLSRSHELTALRSAGVGPLRVSWVFLITAAVASLLTFAALDSVLPATNQKAIELRDRIRGRSPRSYRQPERRWVFGSQGELLTFSSFSPERREMLDLSLLRFRSGSQVIRERIFADRASWKGADGWEMMNGWRRSFSDDGEVYEEFQRFLVREMDPPSYFAQDWKAPDQMNIRELRAHVDDLAKRGYETREIQVGLYRKIAVPAVCVVMVLIALPFGLRIEKRGPLFGLGIALLIAAIYFFLMQVSGKMGEVGVMPPLLAAWAPNVVFSGTGLYLMASSRW